MPGVTGTAPAAARNWVKAVADDLRANPGAAVVGRPAGALIVTADDALNYAFNSFAFSGVPVKVLEAQGGRLVDTTRQHLDLVARDAPQWLKAFNDNPGNGLGYLAGWVADQCLLGRAASAWTAVDQFNAAGRLTGPSGWPTGSTYIGSLRSFLAHHGYC